jgi:ribosome-associated protein
MPTDPTRPTDPNEASIDEVAAAVEVVAADETAPAAEAAPVVETTPAADAAPDVETTPAAQAAPVAARHRPGLPARTSPPPPTDQVPLEVARRIVELAEDKKAADIVLLEIAPLTTVADYLVICSGGSERQLGAIADGIVEGLKRDAVSLIGREGEPDSHWVLLDAGSVVVHVFAPPEREYYALERMWAEARTIVRVQ